MSQFRTPQIYNGLQYNGCKNPLCPKFMVHPLETTETYTRSDGYTLTGRGGLKSIKCKACGTFSILKSNKAIWEEFVRQTEYLRLAKSFCPNEHCHNHHLSVDDFPNQYRNKGLNSSGNQKWKCKQCGKSFTVKLANKRSNSRKFSHAERGIFWDLCNDSSFRRIMGRYGLTPKVLYDKIDLIHRQCLKFAASRESKLANKTPAALFIAMDKQDYMVNWSDHENKKNVQLTAVCSVETQSGYCLGMQVNFSPEIGASDVYKRAEENGDSAQVPCMREYAQYFLSKDFLTLSNDKATEIPYYAQLPTNGSQLHPEYTTFGHCLTHKHLLGEKKTLTFSLDGDSMLANGLYASFKELIIKGQCHVLQSSFNKHMIVDDRKRLHSQSRKRLIAFANFHGHTDLSEAELHMVRENLSAALVVKGRLAKIKVRYPIDKINEPERHIKALTPVDEHLSLEELAEIYRGASIERLDTYFQCIRRCVSPLGRPYLSRSNEGAVWHGKAPYNPVIIQKLLDIHRVYFNYCKKTMGHNGKYKDSTPAMRLGMAKGFVRLEEIIAFQVDH